MNKKKYKIKLDDGNILGPFDNSEFDELLENRDFTGDEKYQRLPSSKWMPIYDVLKIKKSNTLYRKIEEIKRELSKEEGEKQDFIDKELLKENIEFQASRDIEKELREDGGQQERTDNVDRTQVKKSDKGSGELNKTIVRPLSEKEREELARLKKEQGEIQKEEKKIKENIESKALEDKKETVSFDDETKMIVLKDVEDKIIWELKESEKAITQRKEGRRNEKDGEREDEKILLDGPGDFQKEKNEGKKRKAPLFRVLLAIIIGLAFLEIIDVGSKEKEKGGLRPIVPRITFPSRRQFKEVKRSENFESQGDKLYEMRGYLNTFKAFQLYTKSLEYDFDNRSALGKLILSYSELYRDSRDYHRDSEILMKLIRIAEKKIPNDVNYAMGTAIFFYSRNRPLSTIKIIENFLKVNEYSTVKLIRYYMLALMSVGRKKESKRTFEQLKSLGEKDINAYLGIAEYYMNEEDFESADDVFKEAATKFPSSIELLVEYCKVLLHQEDFSRLSTLLNGIKEVSFDRSIYFYSQYLKYMGILYAVQKKQDLAIKFFKKSLSIIENIDLRKKLDELEADSGRESKLSLFINENKTIRLVQKSKQALVREDFNKAISFAINAVDLNPEYYQAVKQLAKVQRVRGHFQNAIDILKKYIKKNIFSVHAKFDLIETYIHAFQFKSAEEVISEIREISPEQERRYKFLLGKYYLFRGDYIPAINELQEAVDRDPLNDEIFFLLGDLYAKNNKFKKAKSLIIKAIELNPGIVVYRSLYGYILYELDGSDVGIGYVRKLLKEFKDHPILMGDIAEYYYKSGQHKLFVNQLKKIKLLPRRSTNLYRSLFKSASLEGDVKEMVKYGRELIRWAPGDLATNLEFSGRLIEIKEYSEALKILYDISDRLPSFPRLHYLFSKIYLAKGDIKGAIDSINREIKNNPYLLESYIFLGQIYLKEKNLPEAKKYFREAQKRGPEDPEALYGMGYVVFSLKQYEEALQLFQKAAQVVPNEPKIRLMLGYTYERMEQRKLAQESFKTYLELDPYAHNKKEIEAKVNALK